MSDLISRKWLMECVDEGWIKFDTEKDKNIYVHLVRDIVPSAQPERKKGEWVDDGLDAIGAMGIEYRWQKCSNCGESISKAPMQRFPNFCSNCGADMRGEQNE